MATLHTSHWNDPAGAPVVCVHGVTAHGGRFRDLTRSTIEREAEAFLDQGEEGRWRWRFSPASVIAAWSEMASPAPPWPDCPTLVVIGA